MVNNIYTANQDIRDYMADHSVSQRMLAVRLGKSSYAINTMLKKELSEKEKEDLLKHIDAIASENNGDAKEAPEAEEKKVEDEAEEAEQAEEEVSCGPKFQVGDRVKIPSKQLTIGIVSDIWYSLVQNKVMYAVDIEGGNRGLYAENQLEPAPLPITYTFESYIDGNVAVTVMKATQGEKNWIHARGHAHIIHDGDVGLAQAVSYSARRMFESLDKKNENKIYVK